MAPKAAKTLTDPNASKIAKKLAGSALSQKGTSKQTGADMEDFASKVLQSDKYNKIQKNLQDQCYHNPIKSVRNSNKTVFSRLNLLLFLK